MFVDDSTQMASTVPFLESLRVTLKAWEKAFASANEGRKAGREDIKKNPSIAQQYKEYARLRANLSSTVSPPASSSSPAQSKKRRLAPSADTDSQSLSSKRPASAHNRHSLTLDSYDASRSAHTPTCHRISIGPTPQKNGNVLGLFDLLSPESALKRIQTPSKSSLRMDSQYLQKGTPSKRIEGLFGREIMSIGTEDGGSAVKLSRTPQSLSKRMYLDTFLTPSARRKTPQYQTPSSNSQRTSRQLFATDETPEFLKRNSQRALFPMTDSSDETRISWSPIALRMPSKPAGIGLSSLVKGLRGMQDEVLDEELDVLREIEAEELCAGNFSQSNAAAVNRKHQILVRESQAEIEMPLGPDRVGDKGDEGSEDEGLQERDSKLKVWKKKGQKRTTKGVNMKPSVAAWKPEPAWQDTAEVSPERDEGKVDDTQIDAGEVGGEDLENSKVENSIKQRIKSARKIPTTAHANFRALKIKNKQSKGKRGAKFGRRR